MRNLLMVLAPRALPEEHTSIRALPVDQVWFRAHTETELEPAVAAVVEQAEGYDNLLMLADDVLVTPAAYHRVAALLACTRVATGYCRFTRTDERVNLTLAPAPVAPGAAGPWRQYASVRAAPSPVLRTWFGGWSLTGMRRERWRKYPFRAHVSDATPHGSCSDQMLAQRLQAAGCKMLAHRDAEIIHTRGPGRWLVGGEEPAVTWHPCANLYEPPAEEVAELREAVRAEAESYRELRKTAPEGYLLSHIDGDSPRFGHIRAGELITTDYRGNPLPLAEMRRAGAGSQYLTFVPWRR